MKTNQLATSAFFSAPDTLQMAGKWTGVDGSSRMGVSEREFTSIIAGVREKERNLIGQELHDNVNQILTTVKLYMEMLRPANTRDKSIKDKSVEYIMMAIEEIRKISRDLVKAKHMESGLVESINRMIDDIQFFKNIKIKFRYTEDIERLNIEKRIALLRITQEQLKNIVKYSEASLVTIELRTHLNNVHLAITDNGIGFDPDQSSNGIGLINIYNRVQLLKGVVNLQTAVGDGCVLSVIIPAN